MSSGRNSPVHPAPNDMEIAPGYTVADWKALQLDKPDSPDWGKAVDMLEARIRRRFLDPVDVLIEHEERLERGTFGFAILAIDCMVMETVQGFREGVVDHQSRSGGLVEDFLTESHGFRGNFPDNATAKQFYKSYRCALLHSGQTDGDLRIQRKGPLVKRENERIDINRTAFHEALKREVSRYLDELRSGSDHGLRDNFRAKMSAVCGIHSDEDKERTP